MTYLSPFDFIGLILICSAICVGFYTACSFDGDEAYDDSSTEFRTQWPRPTQVMLLWWVRYYGGRVLGNFWYKPVYGCLPCMGSLHTIYPTWLYLNYTNFYLPFDFLFIWPVIALSTAGINYLITKFW